MNQPMPEMNIQDVVRDSFATGMETVTECFGVQKEDMKPFMSVVAATRGLQKPGHDELLIPLIKGLLEEFGLDPVNSEEDRKKAEDYAEVIALGVSDAVGMVMQNMQQQARQRAMAEQALAQGQGNLLQG